MKEFLYDGKEEHAGSVVLLSKGEVDSLSKNCN